MIGDDGHQLGILALGDAISLARSKNLDLVEVAPNATPPVCRLVDYGKFRYEQSKKEKETRKHQHANRVKEIQLRPAIDPHDLSIKLGHAVDFLCDDMKVKVTLRFRGREMAHKEFGFQVVQKFLDDIVSYGQPDAPPKLTGKALNVMVSPLPRNKRAQNPRQQNAPPSASQVKEPDKRVVGQSVPAQRGVDEVLPESDSPGFINNPFSNLDIPSHSS